MRKKRNGSDAGRDAGVEFIKIKNQMMFDLE